MKHKVAELDDRWLNLVRGGMEVVNSVPHPCYGCKEEIFEQNAGDLQSVDGIASNRLELSSTA